MMGVMYVQISNKLFPEVLITWKGARFLFSTAHLTSCYRIWQIFILKNWATNWKKSGRFEVSVLTGTWNNPLVFGIVMLEI